MQKKILVISPVLEDFWPVPDWLCVCVRVLVQLHSEDRKTF